MRFAPYTVLLASASVLPGCTDTPDEAETKGPQMSQHRSSKGSQESQAQSLEGGQPFQDGPMVNITRDVKEMKATLVHSVEAQGPIAEFVVPSDHVESVLRSLLPARKSLPGEEADWEYFGGLSLTLRDGQVRLINVYYDPKPPAPFTIENVPSPHEGAPVRRVDYWRGGTVPAFESAVHEAYEASRKLP